MTRPTFHLAPVAVWDAADRNEPYEAEAFRRDGFIHCTDGLDALSATFDRHYRTDPRPFVALTVDLDALDVPWQYDVAGSPYPHIYGAIPWSAIIAVHPVVRAQDGGFDGLGSD